MQCCSGYAGWNRVQDKKRDTDRERARELRWERDGNKKGRSKKRKEREKRQRIIEQILYSTITYYYSASCDCQFDHSYLHWLNHYYQNTYPVHTQTSNSMNATSETPLYFLVSAKSRMLCLTNKKLKNQPLIKSPRTMEGIAMSF